MAITIQAPLAQQLFALGTQVGSSGNEKFNYQSNRPDEYRPANLPQPQGAQNPHAEGQGKAIATVAATIAGQAFGSSPSSTPDANGNGFGIGSNLESGDVGAAKYAGSERTGILQSLMSPQQDQGMPADNGTTPQTNPYALDYGNAAKRKASLFNYSGSYGGASL